MLESWPKDAAPNMSSAAERGAMPGVGIGMEQRGDAAVDDIDAQQPPQKKKQKRNKPTLSCVECVERKTKVRWTNHGLFGG